MAETGYRPRFGKDIRIKPDAPTLVPDARPCATKGCTAAGGYRVPKSRDRLEIVSMTLQPGEDLIVGQRLREILRGARSQRAATRLSGTPS